MIKGLGHIGIAVKDIEKVVKALAKALNIPVPAIKDNKEMKTRFAMIESNGIEIEILEPYGETGMLVDYVAKHGNGIHHICLITDSIGDDMEALKDIGFDFRQGKPTIGVRGKLRATTTDDALCVIPFELSEP
jgi:methylmalonyl-CoA/ethylmalonyl-CoA epimerase